MADHWNSKSNQGIIFVLIKDKRRNVSFCHILSEFIQSFIVGSAINEFVGERAENSHRGLTRWMITAEFRHKEIVKINFNLRVGKGNI